MKGLFKSNSSKKSKSPKISKLACDMIYFRKEAKNGFKGRDNYNQAEDGNHYLALESLVTIIKNFDKEPEDNSSIIEWLLKEVFYPIYNVFINNDQRHANWEEEGKEFREKMNEWEKNPDQCRHFFAANTGDVNVANVSATTLATSTDDITNEFDRIFSKTFTVDQSSTLAKFGTGIKTRLRDHEMRVTNLEKLTNSHRRVHYENEGNATKKEILTFNIESPNGNPQLQSAFVTEFEKDHSFVLQWNISTSKNDGWKFWLEYGGYTTNEFTVLVDKEGYTIYNEQTCQFFKDEKVCAKFVFTMVNNWVKKINQ